MNTIVPIGFRQPCKCCGEPIKADYAHFDVDIGGVVHARCQLRLMLAVQQMERVGIKKCRQVTNGKPLLGLGQ